MVFKFIGLLKNGMEYDGIKGLIWRQNTRKKPQILLKIVTLLSENNKKKVWNGVDPPCPVMENSILFCFIWDLPLSDSTFYSEKSWHPDNVVGSRVLPVYEFRHKLSTGLGHSAECGKDDVHSEWPPCCRRWWYSYSAQFHIIVRTSTGCPT